MSETFAKPDVSMHRRGDGAIILRSQLALPDCEESITACCAGGPRNIRIGRWPRSATIGIAGSRSPTAKP